MVTGRSQRTILWGGSADCAADGHYRRRMVLPAIALERRGWYHRLGVDIGPLPDCVVLNGLQPGDDDRAWHFSKQGVPIVFDAAPALAAGEGLIEADSIRCERVARLGTAVVIDGEGHETPPWLAGRDCLAVPDAVETADRWHQVVLRLGLAAQAAVPACRTDVLWYAEPGDEGIDGELTALLELVPLLRRLRRHCTLLTPSQLDLALHGPIGDAADCLRVEGWSLPAQFAGLHQASVVLLPANPGCGGRAQARRARQALATGVPVVAASGPATERLAPALVLDDWERGLQQSPATLLVAIRELEGRGELPDATAVADCWAEAIEAAVEPKRRHPRRRPYHLMVFADLIGDTDLCVPLIDAARDHSDIELTVVVSSWLMTESPRIGHQLAALGVEPIVVERREVLRGSQPRLEDVDGILTPVSSTHNAHKRAYTLVERAKRLGITTFSMQHGIENPGLTFFDAPPAPPLEINTDFMFVWFPAEHVPEIVPADLRGKLVHCGCNKPVPVVGASLPESLAQHRVGIFENLHWNRYSDAFRSEFEKGLRACALAYPRVDFLLKPHHGGRWSTLSTLGGLPPNILIVDPKDPVWERYTAPSVITGVDAVITTPSTVALDAVRAGKPTALFVADLKAPMFEPLPQLRCSQDWVLFLDNALSVDGTGWARDAFLGRSLVPGVANRRMIDFILKRPRRAHMQSVSHQSG